MAKPDPRENDELCATCGHVKGKHLWGGKTCSESAVHCNCIQFVPSGTYYDYAAVAKIFFDKEKR